ncbi:class I SAM-dependent methyltransferase [Pseudonocardia kujensis]|uniref:class I SAM-dependent methyltransferase n=1 Tax=Pseudonocardia kujensis TaxID=1128675 RepID=UPI001E4FEB15|nr:class I SAM-dependent methyltransferase [Pseudonocardia kujensis]MCE0767890.1 class I SAM-dependent methyltransferase [Pseudonocardia kujensis]
MEWDARLSTPGSPVCAPDWLALREPADAEARAADLVEPLRALAPPLVVRDLGCGSGSMGRWLAPRLPRPQRWFLHDRDPGLLAIAAGSVPGEPVQAELAELTDLAGTTLVTCSALLDLLTAEEVRRLARLCVGAGAAALFTLSVTGGARLAPAEPLDARLAAAFDAHQRRPVAGRRLLGPDAGTVAAEAFGALGATVTTRPSPWRLGPAHPELTEEWLRGWIAAACAQEPALAAEAGPYLRRRLEALAAGELRAEVGHVDLLALT